MTDIEARLAALEAEVRLLRDHIAVTQLVASYGPLADSAIDAEGRNKAVDLFTVDGIYDLGGDWRLQGRDAIASVFDNPEHLAIEAQGAAHIMGLPHVRIDGDHATALNYTQLHRRAGDSYITIRIAANFWELERTPDGWKIRHRRNRLLTGSDEGFALLRKIDR